MHVLDKIGSKVLSRDSKRKHLGNWLLGVKGRIKVLGWRKRRSGVFATPGNMAEKERKKWRQVNRRERKKQNNMLRTNGQVSTKCINEREYWQREDDGCRSAGRVKGKGFGFPLPPACTAWTQTALYARNSTGGKYQRNTKRRKIPTKYEKEENTNEIRKGGKYQRNTKRRKIPTKYGIHGKCRSHWLQ